MLANRLIADSRCRVLLLEAAGSDAYHWVQVSVGCCMSNPRTDWMMTTMREAGLNGRRDQYPRRKVLGGCSLIVGVILMRGQVAEYHHWRLLGNGGWPSEDVLPHFRVQGSPRGRLTAVRRGR